MTDPKHISDEFRVTMTHLAGDSYNQIDYGLRTKLSEVIFDKASTIGGPISWEGLIEEIHNLKKKAKSKQPSPPNAFSIARELMRSLQRAKILSDEEISVFGWSDIVDGVERLLRLYNHHRAEREASEVARQELCEFLCIAPGAISWPSLVKRIKQLTSTPPPSINSRVHWETPDEIREKLELQIREHLGEFLVDWHNHHHAAPESHPGKGAFIPGLGKVHPCNECGSLVVGDTHRCCFAKEPIK